jgi:hypothetical protein
MHKIDIWLPLLGLKSHATRNGLTCIKALAVNDFVIKTALL